MRDQRAAMKLSQSDLAKRASRILGREGAVKQQTIGQLENGEIVTTKALRPIAEALGVEIAWLESGAGPKNIRGRRTVNVVGYVGAGQEIYPFDDHERGTGLEDPVAAPSDFVGDCVAVLIRGDSMHPLKDGWLVFYARDGDGVADACVNRLCVVQIINGPMLIKEVRRGTRKGLWRLDSWNAPPREDEKLEWAAPVIEIRTR